MTIIFRTRKCLRSKLNHVTMSTVKKNHCKIGVSLIAQLVKNPPTMLETMVRFLGWEDPLERGKDTHSTILAWRLYSPWGRKELHTVK